MPLNIFKNIINEHRQASAEIIAYYKNKTAKEALNDFNITIESTRNVHKLLFILISGSIITLLAFIGNLLSSNSTAYIYLISYLKWPLVMLLMSLFFITVGEILVIWFISASFADTPMLNRVRVKYYFWGGVSGWISGFLLFISLITTILIVTSV
jgi:hypothetical protein